MWTNMATSPSHIKKVPLSLSIRGPGGYPHVPNGARKGEAPPLARSYGRMEEFLFLTKYYLSLETLWKVGYGPEDIGCDESAIPHISR